MRLSSPLAIKVGWVSSDRSWGVPRPHFLIAFNCVRNALTLIGASRSTVRSSSRFTKPAFAAALPVALWLENRNSFGSEWLGSLAACPSR